AEDSLNDIISRITASEAGVRASFSNVGGGRVTLNSKNNGPLAVAISDTGNLANALGLNATDSQTMGESAQIRVDGGVVQSFNKNTGITAAGIDGVILDLRAADPGNPVTVTVANNGTVATDKIKSFVDQYNNVISAIDQLTSYDPESGQKGPLLTDSSVKSIKNRLSEMVFGRVTGLSGSSSVGSLTELGFNTGPLGSNVGTTSTLQVDTAKLQKALEADPIRVAQLLGATDTSNGDQGVMEKIKSYLEGVSSISGFINQREKSLNTQITSITERINSLSSRLNSKQIALEHKFTNLELVIAKMKAQQNSLAGLFRNN
ncbi:MAG: flagellar filament capping protein FliD, partial [Candidatus Sericytochromatia bacterium]